MQVLTIKNNIIMNTINSEYDNYNNNNVKCCPSFPTEDDVEDNNTYFSINN